MGEKQAEKKEGEEKGGDGGAGATTVVLKLDLHCEGCTQKVKKIIKRLNGVESVKADYLASKLTVVGKVDPAAVKARVEEKTKKKVELVSPQPAKKDGGGGGDAKKADEKSEKKPDDGKKAEEKKPKEAPVTTVVLKTRVHCDGCAHKMKKIIRKYQGVQDVNVDLAKDQIAIKGNMDMKEMLPYLNAKLKRVFEVVPPSAKKDDGNKNPKDGAGDDKKGKEKAKHAAAPTGGDKKEDAKPAPAGGGGGDGEKKEDAKPAAGGGKPAEENVGKVEIVNKMEHSGYLYGYPTHIYNPQQGPENGYVEEHWHAPPYMQPRPYMHDVPYTHAPPYVQPPPYMQLPPYMHEVPYTHAPPYMHAPQMFSDENPNACSVM